MEGRIHKIYNLLYLQAPHVHPELEFILTIRGSGKYVLGNRKYSIGPGHIAWLFPKQPHLVTDASDDLALWLVKFSPGLVRRYAQGKERGVLRQGNPPGYFCRKPDRQAVRSLEQLLESVLASRGSGKRFDAGLGYLLLTAWDIFLSAGESEVDTELHPAVVRAFQALQEGDLSTPLADVIGDVGLSKSQLSRLFRRHIGMTFVQFRNHQRLERFLRVYGQGQRINMLQAALEAGFGSYPQFYRVFARFMGCAPQDYFRSQG